MGLLGDPTPRNLFPLHNDHDHDRYIGHTIAELLDQRAVLLGALIERTRDEVITTANRAVSDRERHLIEDEARVGWSKKAAGIGDRASYQRLLALGRGEDTDS